ncbi:hypothetical protein SDC9_201735 [bioreactor metagenome]|uniref:Uncharacterized protein n=1 Tax=bioreactor metagenome TaxID=1076179 RepID=A0A645ISH7_9ZZZZ
MVPEARPVNVASKGPVPVSSAAVTFVPVSAIGFADVAYTNPRSVTSAPPLAVTPPFSVAPETVMPVAGLVVTVSAVSTGRKVSPVSEGTKIYLYRAFSDDIIIRSNRSTWLIREG